jgi:hypothetical protein
MFKTKKDASLLKKYRAQYDLVVQSKEARSDFLKFLRDTQTEENLLFMTAVDEYTALDDKARIERAQYIYDKFIVKAANHELNMSANLRQHITEALDKSTKTGEAPLNLFKKVYAFVSGNLKMDNFPKYINSPSFEQFIAQKGEKFLESIAVPVDQIDNLTLLYMPKDFNSDHINDRDIRFILHLNEDSPDWDPLFTTHHHDPFHSYVSNTKYGFGTGVTGLRLGKTIGNMPFSAKTVMTAYINQMSSQSGDMIDPHQVGYKEVEYFPPGTKGIFPNFLLSYLMDLGSMFKRREILEVVSVVYDTQRKCYLLVGKSTKDPELFSKRAEGDHVQVDIVFGYAFYHVSENSSKYTSVFYGDFKTPLMKKQMLKKMMYERALGFHKGLTYHCEKISREGTTEPIGMFGKCLDDYMNKFVPTKKSVQTWSIK